MLIDKPRGITSFDVVRILRRKLGIRKIGHSGTLDPMASGLLIIGIGKGTKRLNDFIKLDKTYKMEILIGKKTDTGDITGKIINERIPKKITKKETKKILKTLIGKITLPVPMYSAIKIKGNKLYELARKNIKPEKIPTRDNKIYSLKYMDLIKRKEYYYLTCEMHCSKGTYARSVAEEIGKQFGYPATLSSLRRVKIGKFKVKDAINIEV